MIDKDTLRTARRTVERNGYTVLPPREKDERALDRFRTRRAAQEEVETPAPRPRYRDVVDEEQPRRFKPLRQREEDVEDERPVRRPTRPVTRDEDDYEDRKPVRRTRPVYQEDDYEDVRPVRKPRQEDDYEDRPVRRPARPVYRDEDDYDDYESRKPARPAQREMNDDEKLGAAIRTAAESGFTIRKLSKLDQAKQVASDNGFEVRKMERPARAMDDDEGNDVPPTRTAPARAQRPLLRTRPNAPVTDGIRTRTAPDTEIKGEQPKPATPAAAPAPEQNDTPAPATEAPAEPKKNTYADDFMNRAARFFGDDVE